MKEIDIHRTYIKDVDELLLIADVMLTNKLYRLNANSSQIKLLQQTPALVIIEIESVKRHFLRFCGKYVEVKNYKSKAGWLEKDIKEIIKKGEL